MTKKSVIQRNLKRINLFKKFIKKRNLLNNSLISKFYINLLPKNSLKVRLRNRCSITGRSRGYFRFFKVSRIELRKKALKSEVSGFFKSSW
ncbi:30S ribosomal protein S14 [Candidatus Vidania fulgoroideorum]